MEFFNGGGTVGVVIVNFVLNLSICLISKYDILLEDRDKTKREFIWLKRFIILFWHLILEVFCYYLYSKDMFANSIKRI